LLKEYVFQNQTIKVLKYLIVKEQKMEKWETDGNLVYNLKNDINQNEIVIRKSSISEEKMAVLVKNALNNTIELFNPKDLEELFKILSK